MSRSMVGARMMDGESSSDEKEELLDLLLLCSLETTRVSTRSKSSSDRRRSANRFLSRSIPGWWERDRERDSERGGDSDLVRVLVRLVLYANGGVVKEDSVSESEDRR